jgi:peptidoglycan-N-acetylglucosamine deacetylase
VRIDVSTYLSRRRLLGAGAVVGALALGGSADQTSKPPSPPGTPRATAVPRPKPPKHRPARPPALPVLKEPVYTLADYRQAIGGPAFPSHAIALTIDDGPHPVWTPKILRLLHKHHVPALFCMIGNQVLGHETTARDVAKDGHLLANHTWSHPTLLGKRRGRLVSKELHKAQEKIHDTTGREPVLFRSPGGDWSPTVLGMAAKQGLIPLDWNKDPNDWSKPGVPFITRRLMKAKPGDILLCHDGGGDRSQTYAALATVIPALKARGLQFVALDRKPQPRTT